MTEEQKGVLIWLVIFYPVWSPRMNWIRAKQGYHRRQAEKRKAGATRSTSRVSRNRQTGPKWEQDVPYPECFEEDDL